MATLTGAFSWQNRAANLATTKFRKEVLSAPPQGGTDKILKLARFKQVHGKKSGETWRIRRRTEVGGIIEPIIETEDLQELDYSDDYVEGRVYEYGFAIPLTQYLDDLSEFDIQSEIRDEIAKAIQYTKAGIVTKALLTDTNCFLTPTAATTATIDCDGTVTTAVAASFAIAHHKIAVDFLKEGDVPTINGRYMAFGYPGAFRWAHDAAQAHTIGFSTSYLTGREVPVIYDCELHEINYLTPRDIGSKTTADLTPVTGRAALTASTQQKWLGITTNGATGVREILYVGGAPNDLVEFAMVRDASWQVEMRNYDRFIGVGWSMVAGAKCPWDETFSGASANYVIPSTQRGRFRSLLVTGTNTLSY